MSAPLCNKRVRVVNTSQEALNGQTGMATTFDHAKGRYNVSIGGSIKQLKPVNLEPLPDASSSGSGMPNLGSIPGFSGFAQNPQFAAAAQQAQAAMAGLQQQLPAGISIQQALGLFAVVGFLLIYRTGFFKGLAITFALAFAIHSGLPAFNRAGGGLAGAKAAARSLGSRIAGSVSARLGKTLTETHGIIILCVLVGVAIIPIVSPSFERSYTPPPYTPPPHETETADAEDPSETADMPDLSDEGMFHAYKKGFSDGKAGLYRNPYADPDAGPSAPGGSRSGAVPPMPSSSGDSSGGGMGKMILAVMMCKTVYDLGGSPWDAQNVMPNLQAMPKWRLALLGFAVFQLVGGGLF